MKKIILSLLVALTFNLSAQIVVPNTWQMTGSSVSTNTAYIGTKNARSLYLRSNYPAQTSYLKLDSLEGALTYKIQNSAPASPNIFTIRKWPTLTTYAGIWFGQNNYRGDNYFLISDTAQTILNGPKNLLFNTGHRRFMSAASTFTQAGSIVTLDAITNTIAVANAELRHFTIAGSVTTWTPGTTTLNRDFLFSAQSHSALTTATITNDVGLEVNAPTAGTGMTQTNVWAISCKGNQNITTQLSIGSSLLVPTARLHLAAGNATMAAMQLTTQTLLTATVTGSIERNGQDLYYTNTAGRMKVGLVLTGSATLNFGSTVAGASTDLTITVTGAVDGDPVMVGVPNGSTVANGIFTAWVSAANTVTVRFTNTNLVTTLDPASGTFKVAVNRN
jgi:hypothetical protein